MEKHQASFEEYLAAILGPEMKWEFGEFRPVAFLIKGLDTLVYVEEDCSCTTVQVPGSNISLLYHSDVPGKIVGVEIACFSTVADCSVREK